jgi:hypothetical protein
MADDYDHGACVDAWMDRVTRDSPPERLIREFEHGFAALWRRAQQTLGDVTLTAILERVLYTSAERFPVLASLKIEATGIQSHGLHERAESMHHDELAQGIRFVLVEFLTVIGTLTAEILTPALHAELSKAREERSPEDKALSGPRRETPSNGEGPES